MRLHLPKALLAAVLAACLSWPAGAANYTASCGDNGAEIKCTDADGTPNIALTTPTSKDTITFNVSAGYLFSAKSGTSDDHTIAANLVINQLNMTNGYSGDGTTAWYYFTGTVSGTGAITRTDAQQSQGFSFSGDMSKYSGDITINGKGGGPAEGRDYDNILKLGAIQVGKEGAAGSITINENSKLQLAGTTIWGNVTSVKTEIGEGNTTFHGNLTNTGTLTNNGTLTISGSYTGGTITQGDNASLILSTGAIVNLDSITDTSPTLDGSNTTGVHTWSASWTLATGGTVDTAENGVIYQYKGKSITGCSVSGGVISANGNYFNIISGDEKTYAEATADASINFINVLGRLTGISDSTTNYFIKGNGIIQVSGTLPYHEGTFLDDFTGTMEIGSGGFLKLGNTANKLGNLTAIKVTGGGQIGGCGTAKPSDVTVELAGGKLTSAGDNLTYSGRVKVTADSTIEPETEKSLTIDGFVDAQGGVITTNGSVKHNGQWDMSGTRNNYTSSLKIASGTFESAGLLWGTADTTKILLEEGASFKKGNFTFTGKADVDSSITFGTTAVAFGVDRAHTAANTTVTFVGGDLVETLGMKMSSSDLVVNSGTLRLGAAVNAANVTVNNNSTLELSTEWSQLFTSSHTWGKNTTLRYVRTTTDANTKDSVDLGVAVGTGTTIELNGVKGTLKAATNDIDRDIRLTDNSRDAAAKFTEIEGDSYTFNGKIVGNGNLNLEQAGHTTKLTFNGDLSGWTSGNDWWSGLYAQQGTLNVTIGVKEGQTIDNSTVANAFNTNTRDGAEINLTIARNATLTNRTTLASLTVGEGKALHLKNNGRDVSVDTDTVIGTGATVTVDNKSTAEDGTVISYGSVDLGTVSGAGTISSAMGAQSIKLSTDTDKAFSGTLEATNGQLTVTGMDLASNVAHEMAGLKANGGNINLLKSSSVELTELVIGANNTVGVYTGDSAPDTATTANEGTLTVTNLTANSGSTLNANLKIGGGTLTLNDSLTMGSTLTLNSGITLGGTAWNEWTDKTQALTLFTSVDSLYIGTTEAEVNKEYDASTVFTNGTGYSLKMTTGDAGDYNVLLVQSSTPTPEPTTATLSLLALMALAARRRRKA